MNDNLKQKVVSSLSWKFMDRIGVQGIQFVVQIILARLLFPEDYGVLTLITIFISVANVFIQQGFNTALVQKKEVDELDLSSCFFINLVVALVLYTILFFGAPLIGKFYGVASVVPVLRILSLSLFFGSINSIQNAIVSRSMKFKRFFLSNIGSIVLSGIVGIVLAYMGYGVWALVFQQLTSAIVTTLILWFTVKWRPTLKVSLSRVKVLLKFGWKLIVSSFIDTIYQNLYALVIGKAYDSEMLGHYNRGNQFPYLIADNVSATVSSVMLPAFSKRQDDKVALKSMVRRSMVTSCFVLFPMMFGLAAVAEPIVRLLLTDKWLVCVPFMQIMCFVHAFNPIHIANLQAINAMGRSDIYLKLEIIKKVIGIIILIVTLPFSIYIFVAFKFLSTIISTFVNASPNKKLLNYSYKEQIKDILPSLVLALFMALSVYLINFINIVPIVKLIIQLVLGFIVYFGVAKLFKFECLEYLINTIKEVFKNRKKAK